MKEFQSNAEPNECSERTVRDGGSELYSGDALLIVSVAVLFAYLQQILE